MPHHQLKPSSEPLTLLYRNGEVTSSDRIIVPRFSDICLTKDSQTRCDDLIDEAKKFEQKIRSEDECKEFIALHSLVDELLDDVNALTKHDREPFVKILSQISTALEPVHNKLVTISRDLKERIQDWRDLVVQGQIREKERLEAQAAEKHNEAKYTDDPKKKRQATVQAKELEKEAKAAAPKVEKGIDTEGYWEGEIQNRVLAAKLPDDLVAMEVNQGNLNKRIKARERAGDKITPNIFAGLSIERKTRVRFHK